MALFDDEDVIIDVLMLWDNAMKLETGKVWMTYYPSSVSTKSESMMRPCDTST
jgi:hypothetical protein